MKQFRFFSLIVLGTLVLGACSTSNDVVGGGIFQKRKYTGGVYWDRSEKLKSSKETEEEQFDIFRSQEESQRKYVSTTTIRTDEPVKYDVTDKTIASVDAEPTFISEESTSSKVAVVETAEEAENTNVVAPVKEKKSIKVTKKQPAGGADGAMLIVLVILAIIIPPLAVFIYEGASKRFIIDLILAILGWGIGFWLLGGLGWIAGLAAIIYALLIVLGAI